MSWKERKRKTTHRKKEKKWVEKREKERKNTHKGKKKERKKENE